MNVHEEEDLPERRMKTATIETEKEAKKRRRQNLVLFDRNEKKNVTTEEKRFVAFFGFNKKEEEIEEKETEHVSLLVSLLFDQSQSKRLFHISEFVAKQYKKEEDRIKATEEEEQDMFEDAVCNKTTTRVDTPLSVITEAFEDLADLLKPKRSELKEEEDGLRLDAFCRACTHVSVLFSCLGFAFKFAETEYVSKVKDLIEASKTLDTLQNILDLDVKKATVKTQGSHSRNLRRVRQGLDLIRAIFEQFLITDEFSLKEAATTAYTQVCAPFHTWAVRTAVYAGMYTLPTRDQLLLRLNEKDQSVEKNMRRYIEASRPIIDYIDKLYIQRNIKLDW